MKLLYIIYGPPGTGKSTFSVKLSKEIGIKDNSVICCADDFHIIDGEYKWKLENQNNAHKACREKCEHLMRSNSSRVIIANTNTKISEMVPYIDMAKIFGYSIAFCYPRYNFSSEELYSRNVHNVPISTIESMKNRLTNNEKIKQFMQEKYSELSCLFLIFENK